MPRRAHRLKKPTAADRAAKRKALSASADAKRTHRANKPTAAGRERRRRDRQGYLRSVTEGHREAARQQWAADYKHLMGAPDPHRLDSYIDNHIYSLPVSPVAVADAERKRQETVQRIIRRDRLLREHKLADEHQQRLIAQQPLFARLLRRHQNHELREEAIRANMRRVRAANELVTLTRHEEHDL